MPGTILSRVSGMHRQTCDSLQLLPVLGALRRSGPALYPAAACRQLPPAFGWRRIFPKYLILKSIVRLGLLLRAVWICESVMLPNRALSRVRAVPGMICPSPAAPTLLTAFVLPPDSTIKRACAQFRGTPCVAAAVLIWLAYGANIPDLHLPATGAPVKLVA